jgi:hypothetical protein
MVYDRCSENLQGSMCLPGSDLLMSTAPRMLAVLLDIRPTKMRIVKLIAILLTCMHLYACAFWKVRKNPSSLWS